MPNSSRTSVPVVLQATPDLLNEFRQGFSIVLQRIFPIAFFLIDFASESEQCMRLENYPEVYQNLRANPEVRADLEEWLTPGGKPAYMIVGLLIWKDASFEETVTQDSSLTGKAKVPVASASTKAHTGTSTGAGDPAHEATKKEARQVMSKGTLKGQSIFAFEYKAVRRRPYSLFGDTTPKTVENYGPRVSGDKLFAGTDDLETELIDKDIGLEMDEDESMWTDALGDSAPSEEEFGDMILAFHADAKAPEPNLHTQPISAQLKAF
ncbi:hypothetical protein B7463_g4644, partial [Scytalidium lignicola]